MSHAKNKVQWCLDKAQKELQEGNKHRGLLRVQPDEKRAKEHMAKAEHNLQTTLYLHDGGYTDWCSSTLFYTIYHCFLAVLIKCGYESRNQECTFALIESLTEEEKTNFDINDLKEISSLCSDETTAISIRERYQYSPKISLGDAEYGKLLNLAKKIVYQTKELMERIK